MSVERMFKELLDKHVAPVLKVEGFRKRGQLFFRRIDLNWQLIQFQRSTTSTALRMLFTVNLGIASERLLRFHGRARPNPPDITWWHWDFRLGQVLPPRQDKWWEVSPLTNIEELAAEIVQDLKGYALPIMSGVTRDEALRDLWLTGQCAGLTNAQRLENLLVLVKALGPSDLYPRLEEELRAAVAGKAGEASALFHLEMLRKRVVT